MTQNEVPRLIKSLTKKYILVAGSLAALCVLNALFGDAGRTALPSWDVAILAAAALALGCGFVFVFLPTRRQLRDTFESLQQSMDQKSAELDAHATALKETSDLRETAERDRNGIWDLSIDLLCIAGFDGYFKQVNPAWGQTFVYSDQELLETPYLEFVHPDDQHATVETVAAGSDPSQGRLMGFENRLRCKDGSYRWLSWSAQPVVAESVSYCVAHDITDNKAETERRSRQLLAERFIADVARDLGRADSEDLGSMIEHSLAGLAQMCQADRGTILMIGPDERSRTSIFEWCAPSIESRASQSLRNDFTEYGHWYPRISNGEVVDVGSVDELPDDADAECDVMRSRGIQSLTAVPIVSDGSLLAILTLQWIRESAAPEMRNAPLLRTISGIIASALARDKGIKALEDARDEAEAANQAKTEFLSRMSHDLRTPLNAIFGFAQLLQMDQTLSDTQKTHINRIVDGGRNLLDLVDHVLDLARIESGRLALLIEPVDLTDLVHEAVQSTRPLADARSVTVNLDVPAAMPLVLADRSRLRQVLFNLLSNAVKYNHDNGLVDITCQQENDHRLHLTVRDTGHGIPHERLATLFEPFIRLEHGPTYGSGTGIGLAVARQLMEAMAGDIHVESTIGKGSVFTITVPIACDKDHPSLSRLAESQVPYGDSDEQGSQATTHMYQLLYVEDNPANPRLVEEIVKERPHIELLTSPKAEDGLELIKNHLPDLILLDVHLPGMSGLDMIRILRDTPETRDITAVALSADAMPQDISKALDAGFQRYVTKPVNVVEILRLLDEFLPPPQTGSHS